MKLLKENPRGIEHLFDTSNFDEIYYHAEYLRRMIHYLNDSDDKWMLSTRAHTIQDKINPAHQLTNSKYSTIEAYLSDIKKFEDDLSNHIGTHQDPFIL